MNRLSRERDLFDDHTGRVLLLIHSFATPKGGIDSLTKLAKLDFLLRYPVFLEQLVGHDELPTDVAPSTDERLAVDNPMIRYRYGPWDHRYYTILGRLLGLGLITREERRGKTIFRPTAQGRELAKRLGDTTEWVRTRDRCRHLRARFNVSGNALKERIYRELPDVVDRPIGKPIR